LVIKEARDLNKIHMNKLGLIIITTLLSILIISQVPSGFSQQTSMLPTALPPPGSTIQVCWNGSAWTKLSVGQQVTTAYQGVTNITVPNLLPQMITGMNITYPNPTELNNALSFFSDVADIDLSHYNVQLMPTGQGPSISNTGTSQPTKSESYVLYSKNGVNSTDGTINIMCMLEGNTIYYLDISSPSSKTPFYLHPVASSVQDQVSQFLGSYADYSNDPTIASLKNLIATSSLTGTSIEGLGDSTLHVTNAIGTQNSPYVTLDRAPTTINNTYDTIVVSYNNGMISQFVDFWNRVPVGSFDVNINQNDALQTAENAARNFSFTANGETVSNFTLSNAPNAVICDLQMQPRDGSLYPLYGFSLGLSRTFAGGITELQVGVWADTGQIAGINYVSSYNAISSGGTPSQFGLSSPASTSNSESTATQPIDVYIAITVIIVASALTVSAVILKKRKV